MSNNFTGKIDLRMISPDIGGIMRSRLSINKYFTKILSGFYVVPAGFINFLLGSDLESAIIFL